MIHAAFSLRGLNLQEADDGELNEDAPNTTRGMDHVFDDLSKKLEDRAFPGSVWSAIGDQVEERRMFFAGLLLM